jgi:hypothetical protein
VPDQEDELELVLARSPGPGESAEAVLVGKQLYFPGQETDVDLLSLLRPYRDVQVLNLCHLALCKDLQCGSVKWALLCRPAGKCRQGT